VNLNSKRTVYWLLGLCFLVGLIAVLIWFSPLRDYYTDQGRLVEWLSQLGKWAPLITIGLHILQVITAPIPGTVIDAVNGFLFGPYLGTLYSMIGLMLGSTLVMATVRRFGRPLAERLVEKESFNRFSIKLQRYGKTFIFVVFLLPFMPDDVICVLAGLTKVPMIELFFLALVGRTPGVFIANWIGSRAGEMTIWYWIGFGLVVVITLFLYWHYQTEISQKMENMAAKFSDRVKKRSL